MSMTNGENAANHRVPVSCCALLVAILLLVNVGTVLAWGIEGHKIIAQLAYSRLTPKARTVAQELLGSESFVGVAGWADQVKHQFPENNVHYNTITKIGAGNTVRIKASEGQSVISGIHDFIYILADQRKSEGEKRNALKFLIHFVGDVHCPIHCGPDRDRGGTRTKVTFFGKATNLHWVWDTGLIRAAKVPQEAYVKGLESMIRKMDTSRFHRGKPLGWALESSRVARQVVWALPPDNVLGERYYEACIRPMNIQMIKAGIRLAEILNKLFS